MSDLVKYSEKLSKILSISTSMGKNFGMQENCSLRWNILNGVILAMSLRKHKLRVKRVDLMYRTILLASTKWLKLALALREN